MGTVEFDVFDADNHYYEATDAFIRHLPKHRSKLVQWAQVDGKQRMIVDNKLFRFIPNPTFDPVARPGSLDDGVDRRRWELVQHLAAHGKGHGILGIHV